MSGATAVSMRMSRCRASPPATDVTSSTTSASRDAFRLQIDLSGFHLREIEDVVDQLKKMPGALQDEGAELGIFRRHRAEPLVSHDLRESDDRVERRAQLVRHVGDELALQPAAFLDAAVFDFEHLPSCRFFTSLRLAL